MKPVLPVSSATLSTSRRLRRDATDAERKLWRGLRNDQLGVRFRRQHPVAGYFADFACVEARLIVEVDGGQHTPERDAKRNAVLAATGWRVLRFWNNDVMAKTEGVLVEIKSAVIRGLPRDCPPP